MFERPSVQEKSPNLNRLVSCAICGSPMLPDDGNYVCPKSIPAAGPGCSNTPHNGDLLLRRTVTALIGRAMTRQTIQEIIEDIEETVKPSMESQRGTLEKAEAEISGLNRRRSRILDPVEQGTRTYEQVASQINEINASTAGLTYEAQVARKELDKLEFINDRDGIEETAMNPETYLAGARPEDVQELINLFVESIRVDTKTAVVRYSDLIPSNGMTAAQTDEIPLDQ